MKTECAPSARAGIILSVSVQVLRYGLGRVGLARGEALPFCPTIG